MKANSGGAIPLRYSVFGVSSIAAALAVIVFFAFNFAGCGSESTTGSTTSSCKTNNTAKVRFENKSTTNQVYTVVWDGSVLTSISPGSTSDYFTVSAGVPHILEFKFANSSNAACTTSFPNPAQCTSHTYWCTG